MKPLMPRRVRERYEALLAGASGVVEYGAGGSTSLAASLGVPVVSAETDAAWASQVRADAPGAEVIHVDVGPTKRLGYPEGRRSGWKYALAPWQEVDASDVDLVLIDGRFRVLCFAVAMQSAKPGTVIAFDDYRKREHYWVAEALCEPRPSDIRLAEFVVPDQVDLDAVRALVDAHRYDPR